MLVYRFLGKIIGVVVFGLVLTASVSVPAVAQTKAPAFSRIGLTAESNLPMSIQSDGFKTDPKVDFAEFYGQVKVVQGQFMLTAEHLKVYYRGRDAAAQQNLTPSQQNQQIEKIVASGSVKIEADGRLATTDRAEYVNDSQILVLYGDNSRVVDGDNTLTGQKITVFRKEGRITVNRGDDRRVEAVLYTNTAMPQAEPAADTEPVTKKPEAPVAKKPAPQPLPAAPAVTAPEAPAVAQKKASEPLPMTPSADEAPAPATPPVSQPQPVAEKSDSETSQDTPVAGSTPGVAPERTSQATQNAAQDAPAELPTVMQPQEKSPDPPAQTEERQTPATQDVDDGLLSRWMDIKSILPERWLPQVAFSGPTNRVALMGFEDRVQFKGLNANALVQERFFKRLQQACDNISFVLPGDAGYPQGLDPVPTLTSGRPDNYEIALLARQSGVNAVVSSALVEVRPIKLDRGLLMFRDRYDFVRVTVWLQVYDAYSGTKLMDQTFEDQFEIDELDVQAIEKNEAFAVPGLEEMLEEVLADAADALCGTLRKQPWHGFIKSVAGRRVVLSCGRLAGLKVGDTLKVRNDREISGVDGHRYFVPGPKSAEIRIVEVDDNQAVAEVLTGSLPSVGDAVSAF